MSVWPCTGCGVLTHIDFWAFSGNKCPTCAGEKVINAYLEHQRQQAKEKEDALQINVVGYQTFGMTIFNKRALDYIGGPPPWYRRLYWWAVDTTRDIRNRWHEFRHFKYFRRAIEGRRNGVKCTKCNTWIEVQL